MSTHFNEAFFQISVSSGILIFEPPTWCHGLVWTILGWTFFEPRRYPPRRHSDRGQGSAKMSVFAIFLVEQKKREKKFGSFWRPPTGWNREPALSFSLVKNRLWSAAGQGLGAPWPEVEEMLLKGKRQLWGISASPPQDKVHIFSPSDHVAFSRVSLLLPFLLRNLPLNLPPCLPSSLPPSPQGTARARLPVPALIELGVRPGDGIAVFIHGFPHAFLCSAAAGNSDEASASLNHIPAERRPARHYSTRIFRNRCHVSCHWHGVLLAIPFIVVISPLGPYRNCGTLLFH